MYLDLYGTSHVGVVRSVNEDSFRYQLSADKQLGYIALADGMGGYNGGDIASQIAIKTVSNHFSLLTLEQLSQNKEWDEQLNIAIHHANQEIWQFRNQKANVSQMGTTIVAAIFSPSFLTIAHVGDSRAYLFRDTLSQLTKDDTVIQEMVDQGTIQEHERDSAPYQNVLTKALGTQHVVENTRRNFALVPNDLLLFCSDGLTHLVNDQIITKIIQENRNDLQLCVQLLIKEAIQAGGSDNITIIMAAVNDNAI